MFIKTYKGLPIEAVRGEGVYIYDKSGKKYLDMYAGHAVASTGHCHPTVVNAVTSQVKTLMFYSNALSVNVREEACANLIKHAPQEITHALFINSGAEAIENALKIAIQLMGRKEIVAMEKSFHGRTLLALNVTHGEKYRKNMPYKIDPIKFAKFGNADDLEKCVTDKTACVIMEPIQSMAGMRMAEKDFYATAREICTKRGAYLIYDEIQTGIGRTGQMFFAGRFGVVPDIICLAKGIASGIPMGAVLTTTAIADKIEYLEYGSTFGAGPIAMAAMNATIKVIEEENLLTNVQEISAYLFSKLKDYSPRGLGFMIGMKSPIGSHELQKKLLDKGVIVGGSDDPEIIRLLPPLTLKKEHVDEFIEKIRKAL